MLLLCRKDGTSFQKDKFSKEILMMIFSSDTIMQVTLQKYYLMIITYQLTLTSQKSIYFPVFFNKYSFFDHSSVNKFSVFKER